MTVDGMGVGTGLGLPSITVLEGQVLTYLT